MIANQSRKRKGFLEPIPILLSVAEPPFAPCTLRPAAYFINFVTASV